MKNQERDITLEEIKFLDGVIGGKRQYVAFREAFPERASKMTDASLRVKACELMKAPHIREEYNVRRKELEEKLFMTADYKRAELKAIWEDMNNSLKDRLAAMKLDAQLAQQLNQKIELAGGVNLTHAITPDVTEALDKLFE